MDITESKTTHDNTKLKQYLSPVSVWALSFGCAVGWGAFVMPGTTFLPIAGPLGTVIGMVLSAIAMLIIGYNYHYLMNRYPDAGGTYLYTKKVFGYDHGFISAWYLVLVYIAITWANATALPLILRNLIGDTFQFGYLYSIAGYDVYFGDVMLSLAALWIFGFLCIRGGKAVSWLQTGAAFVLFVGVFIGFFATINCGGNVFDVQPSFMPEVSPAAAIFGIAVLSPWAFVGFESISHSTEEFNFSPKKSFAIIFAAVAAGCAAYVFLALIAVSVLPPGYSNWVDYIGNLDNLSGYERLPTFFAVHELFGNTGMVILAATVTAAVVTGIIGNSIAASRLIYSMARDKLFPRDIDGLGEYKTPKNVILFIMLLSLPIPFMGRTAIGWIIDVNTIGATIAYAYTSAVAFKIAQDNLTVKITGAIGTIVSGIFFLYLMIPNFWSISAMATESYLILIGWSIVGFIFFRYIFQRDTQNRFGKSTVAWMVLLFLIFFTSTMWLRQSTHETTKTVLDNLTGYYVEELSEHGAKLSDMEKADANYYLEDQIELVNFSLTLHNAVQMILIIIALFIMFSVYNLMMSREKKLEVQKVEAEQSNKAKSTFLSNMSHDIRTPMNAIIGYTTLLRKEKGLPASAENYLDKIEASNKHLLALINDVLDMSRIESGKMELAPAKTDLVKTMGEVRDLFATQMEGKGLKYVVSTAGVSHKWVMCDAPRLNRVLLNLISNAFKFTPEGGTVSVTLSEIGAEENVGNYELRVKDTGMGMTPEFAAKVFEAYSRDRTVNNIQGTGLGMSITKSIVELMGGNISVESEYGKGTEFIVRVNFPLVEDVPEETEKSTDANTGQEIDFTKIKLLLVDDNEVNREIASLILTEHGFSLETAENGKAAIEKLTASEPNEFQVILMDVQMPVMNGYEATRAIRKFADKQLANIPIIAMTANAFTEDIQLAKDAGMNDHIAKPIDIPKMLETLTRVLKQTGGKTTD